MSKKVVDPHYAKDPEYKKVINTIADEAKCPFCPDNFKYHKNPILKTIGNWKITKSSWPYKGTQHHFLLIAETHHERLSELAASDWAAIGELVTWAESEYKLPGGALAMRFGETNYTGASVCHLHVHLIVPEIDPETNRAKVVHFPIG